MKSTPGFLSATAALTLSLAGVAPAAATWDVDVLVPGLPEAVGMHSLPLLEMVHNLTGYTHPPNYSGFSKNDIHPIEPGGTVLVARRSTIVSAFDFGQRSRCADADGTLLPRAKQKAATLDTIYDMASLTKLFTTVAALREMDAGRIALSGAVADHVPEFAVNGKGEHHHPDAADAHERLRRRPFALAVLGRLRDARRDARRHTLAGAAQRAGRRILSQEAVDLIFTNLNARFNDTSSAHGAGFELNQYYTAGPLNKTLVASHTGFTGTSVAIDRGRDLFYVHFSNRVHPSRNWSSDNIVREAVGYWVGTSLGLSLAFPPAELNRPDGRCQGQAGRAGRH